jgi:hypothetical protein
VAENQRSCSYWKQYRRPMEVVLTTAATLQTTPTVCFSCFNTKITQLNNIRIFWPAIKPGEPNHIGRSIDYSGKLYRQLQLGYRQLLFSLNIRLKVLRFHTLVLQREAGISCYHINLQNDIWSQLTELQHVPLIYCSLVSVLQPKHRQLRASMCLWAIPANHE